jgi:predicted PurR-regulated permease PerM
MPANRFYFLTVLFMVVLLGYLTYEIFQPFLTAIAWAMVVCVVFYPAYAFVLKFVRLRAIASLLTLVLIVVVVMGPFSYISFALVSELSSFVEKGGTENAELVTAIKSDRRIISVIERIEPFVGMKGVSAEDVILGNMRKLGTGIVDRLSAGFTNLLGVAANFIIMLFTSFFLFKDGGGFLDRLRRYLPFSEEQKDRLGVMTKDMVVSTIYGGVIVALVQGAVGGFAFALLNIGSPVLWGSVMALVSFVPMLGTAIVWVPASLILFYEGLYLKGTALILIGIFIISMVDSILKPLIIGGRTKMPTAIIFFTVLGGIRFFGLLGLIMGPLVFALFLSVFEILRTMEEGSDA